ncbi:MAG: hypothetical protein HN919_16080 [Verrucomicrobia bacterium]|jgi:hypothetical protein|nr:hypothetical protein [Verrucomicrobiota bacterium]MBT7067818.1 hypothetical protein [Verrucomicrobiota bacterium]MBT7701962.1 hypothetical protein [Verrucomicrobiota bacterium]
MILSDRFVFIHYPKTGGSFVRSVLKRVLDAAKIAYTEGGMHDTCADIPVAYHGVPVVTCVRNPYDIRVSEYKYRWWATDASPALQEQFLSYYAHYPELSFEEYVRAWHHCTEISVISEGINPYMASMGQYSKRFIKTFARDPSAVFLAMSNAFMQSDAFHAALHDVTYLHTDSLNADLYAFLCKQEFSRRHIRFVRSAAKILPPGGHQRDGQDHWLSYYTPELKAEVRAQERLLFRMFPRYDV